MGRNRLALKWRDMKPFGLVVERGVTLPRSLGTGVENAVECIGSPMDVSVARKVGIWVGSGVCTEFGWGLAAEAEIIMGGGLEEKAPQFGRGETSC